MVQIGPKYWRLLIGNDHVSSNVIRAREKRQVCQVAGDADGAQAAWKQSQGIVAELKVSDDSELGRAVGELMAVMERAAP